MRRKKSMIYCRCCLVSCSGFKGIPCRERYTGLEGRCGGTRARTGSSSVETKNKSVKNGRRHCDKKIRKEKPLDSSIPTGSKPKPAPSVANHGVSKRDFFFGTIDFVFSTLSQGRN